MIFRSVFYTNAYVSSTFCLPSCYFNFLRVEEDYILKFAMLNIEILIYMSSLRKKSVKMSGLSFMVVFEFSSCAETYTLCHCQLTSSEFARWKY